MKKLFNGIILMCIAALIVACGKESLQQEENGDKIQISLLFSIGNSPLSIGEPMAGTKGTADGLFDAIYEGIVSGEIIASYELTFKNINTGTSTTISGNWTDNKTISLEKGTYTIYGISAATGKGIYQTCSLSYQDEVTITPQTRSITIKAQYDCSLLILNDDSVDRILYYASQKDSTSFSQYHNLTYAFVKSAEDFTQGNKAFLKVYFKNGKSGIVDLGQINIQKGKYYLLENLNNYADANLVLDIDKMENGSNYNGIYPIQPIAYFPADYANKNVAAWYTLTEQYNNKEKIEAAYFFVDNTFLATKVNVFTIDDGRDPEYSITATGVFELTSGDFTNGNISIIIEGQSMSVTLSDGKMNVMDEYFIKQNNSEIPTPLNLGANSGNSEKTIEFGIYNTKATRAYISTNSDVANNGGFLVWGFKKPNNSSNWIKVLNEQTVVSLDNGNTWTYAPARYWDTSADGYRFYAAAPVQNANGTITFADNTVCVNNVHYAKKSDADVECKVHRGVYTVNGSIPDRVDFTFSHIMANLVVKVNKDQAFDNVTVKINSLTINGWNGGNGNFKMNPELTNTDDISEWTIPTYSNGELDMVDQNGVYVSTSNEVVGDYLMIPQTISDNCTLTIKYVITSQNYSENYTYQISLKELFTKLSTGLKYITTFTIKPNVITFDVSCLNDWEDGNNSVVIF